MAHGRAGSRLQTVGAEAQAYHGWHVRTGLLEVATRLEQVCCSGREGRHGKQAGREAGCYDARLQDLCRG